MNETNEKLSIHHGHNIRRFRKFINWTQEDLAEKLNTTSNVISRKEQQETLSEEELVTYAKALGIKVELLKNTPEENPLIIFNISENEFNDNSGNGNTNIFYRDDILLEQYKQLMQDFYELKAKQK